MPRIWLAVPLLLANCCFAQLPGETDRLMSAARLWVTVNYFHPFFLYNDIDWDQALVDAIPKIRSATSSTEYQSALSGMLDQLHDPETHLISDVTGLAERAPSREITVMNSAAGKSAITGWPGRERIFIDMGGATAVVRLSVPQPTAIQPNPRLPVPVDAYPSTEARLLAAIKLYGAIHYFFAYKDLMDDDWEEIFPTYLPKFIAATDATSYNLVLSDLLTHLTDTNSTIHSKTLDTYFGEASVSLQMRLLNKYPIITAVRDPVAIAAGIQPGDVLKRIAGTSTTDIFRRFVQYVPASTPQRSGYDTLQKVAAGPAGSEVELSIEDAKGESHLVKLLRIAKPDPQRTTDALRILPGGIGYLDLERLAVDDLDKALAKLKDTKAIILDLRAPLAPAAAALATHLTNKPNLPVALVTTPIALHPDVPTEGIATQTASTFVVRTLPQPTVPLYKGKTVALIDERTIGEAEHAGLLFEAANKTEFIGEPSAGAYSAITTLFLPGQLTVTYSIEDIRHANGGKLQRLGLQPNILAPTTAKGLHAGKDEPLEAALAHLTEQLARPEVLYSNKNY